jgi:3-oxoadipate enol-lactonase
LPFAETKDLRIHYQLDGPAAAPVLLLSNSLGTNLSLWEPQIPAFATTFRVLRYDSRGHGQTPATVGDYSIELLAHDALNLLDTLKFDRVHFCGLSIGGLTGMWLGAHAPQRFDKLILSNTAPKIGIRENWNARIQSVRDNGTKSISEGVVEKWFTAPFRAKEPVLVAKTKQMIDTTSTAGYNGSCAAVRDADLWSELRKIQAPTLVFGGTHDQSVPAANAQKFAQQIQGAKFIELDAAHISNIEAAEKFTAEAVAFFNY